MTAIIIEDEALAARELESILKKLAPEIEIVARQDSVRGSVQWLKENQVDLIFSDVHLGDGRSFDIFEQVEIKAPVTPDGPISGALFGADRNEDQIRTGGRSRLFYGRWKIPDVIYPRRGRVYPRSDDGCTRRTPGSPNLFSDQPEVYSGLFCYQRNDPLFQQPHKNRFISFAS